MRVDDDLKNLINPIFRYIYFRVNNKEIAEDLTQDCFLSVINYLQEKTGNSVDNLRAFLYSTARNKLIDYYRQKDRANKMIDAGNQLIEEVVDWRNFENASELNLILEKLNLLNEEDRNILIMRYVDDLEIKDIAKIIGRNSVATRVKISRALKKARKLYND